MENIMQYVVAPYLNSKTRVEIFCEPWVSTFIKNLDAYYMIIIKKIHDLVHISECVDNNYNIFINRRSRKAIARRRYKRRCREILKKWLIYPTIEIFKVTKPI